ncbi:hypothetical protein ABT112_08995 [Streptomyces sp. NPDC002055]|uniref:hypothetical protein n=1 Tax=Streptomyces sp. NPDC002055 TaxID=3154534 RepID=UPI003318DC90
MRHRTMSVFTLAALAVLLAGCGGSTEESKSKEIEGAGKGRASSRSTPPAADDDRGPKVVFPADFKIALDWQPPSDGRQASVLDDAVNYVRGIRHGVITQNPNDAAYLFYATPLGNAKTYAKDQIEERVKGGWTITGVDRYSRPQVRVDSGGKRAAVSFCRDQSKAYSKELRTRRVLRTQESDSDFSIYEIVMEAAPEGKLWQANSIEVKPGAEQCRK